MILQVVEDLDLSFVVIHDLVHLCVQLLLDEHELIFQRLRLRCAICDLETYLLKDVQLSLCVEDSLPEVIEAVVLLLVFLMQLLDVVLVVKQLVLHRLD